MILMLYLLRLRLLEWLKPDLERERDFFSDREYLLPVKEKSSMYYRFTTMDKIT